MTNISADLIKELRALTGVGMSKCKEALSESSGNLQDAINYLRKKGMASGAKKEGRETKEGAIVFAENSSHVALLEVNAETDFVVQNEKFMQFAKEVAAQALRSQPTEIASLMAEAYAGDPSLSLDQYRNLVIQSLGENIQVKRVMIIAKEKDSSLGIYSHMGGKILSIVEIQGSVEKKQAAKEVAMHVAAYDPEFLQREDVPQEVQEKEKEIARSQAKGKPENVLQKIEKGKLEAYYKENCLKEQPFAKDPSKSVSAFVESQKGPSEERLVISRYLRWKVGQ